MLFSEEHATQPRSSTPVGQDGTASHSEGCQHFVKEQGGWESVKQGRMTFKKLFLENIFVASMGAYVQGKKIVKMKKQGYLSLK